MPLPFIQGPQSTACGLRRFDLWQKKTMGCHRYFETLLLLQQHTHTHTVKKRSRRRNSRRANHPNGLPEISGKCQTMARNVVYVYPINNYWLIHCQSFMLRIFHCMPAWCTHRERTAAAATAVPAHCIFSFKGAQPSQFHGFHSIAHCKFGFIANVGGDSERCCGWGNFRYLVGVHTKTALNPSKMHYWLGVSVAHSNAISGCVSDFIFTNGWHHSQPANSLD